MSDAKLKELYAKRSSVKGRLTKFKNYLASFENVNVLDDFEISKLNIQLSKIESLSITFEELQNQIEVINSTDIDNELDERDIIEQEFASLIAIAQQYQSKHNEAKPFSDAHSSSSCGREHPGIGFKPPTLQIGKFDGSYYKWLEFRDLYCSLVHENKHIPIPVKFCYLNSYLEGEASRVISNLEVTEANYIKAWDLLRERYDNKRLLIKNHLNSLLNFEMKSSENASILRSIIDNTNKNLRALSSLGEPTSYWDTIIVHIISSKLSSKTSMKWEEYRNTLSESPTLEQFNTFLKQRADILETYNHSRGNEDRTTLNIHKPNNCNKKRVSTIGNNNSAFTSQITPSDNISKSCVVCNNQHRIYDCPKFRNMSIEQRQGVVGQLKLCQNCLRPGHRAFTCRFGVCRNCKRRHNTLLCHDSNLVQTASPENDTNIATKTGSTAQTLCTINSSQNHNITYTLLSTALVLAINPSNNKREVVRVLLDCGSQCSLASKRLRDKLCLSSRPAESINVVGIGNSTLHCVNEFCAFQLKSLHSDYTVSLTCPVLSDLTGDIPKSTMNPKFLNIPTDVQLADPSFYKPSPIDVLVGADLFWSIVGNDRQSLGYNKPYLINSEFGWILSGPIYLNSRVSKLSCNFSNAQSDDLNKLLSRFWELEELPPRSLLSEEEKACEQHFKTHTSRDSFGRFCVRLPLKDSPDCLGNSYLLAKKRFFHLEKRFRARPELKSQYVDFINEYIKLGHCSVLTNFKPNPCYFLCHHAVLKQNSESTKLRVVFDGSARTSSGVSINDLQLIGPTVQDSLFSILLRFRQYLYVLAGDVEKMFRQINLHEDDRNLQLILWRDDESKPIQTLRLNTVTYGFASASYLSTKCIWQLGEECTDESIRTIIQHDFYMDDLLTGANSIRELRHILKSVVSILHSGCFPLRKFKSNVPSIFENTLINPLETLTLSESTSTLGLQWQPSSDSLHVLLNAPNGINEQTTKRSILANMFKTFDPLGLVSPCTIRLKILMQDLWRRNIGWDEPVPSDIQRYWNELIHEFQNLSSVTVPRLVLCDSPVSIEVHSFCDASISAHGACVYLRSVDSSGYVVVKLLCAKSKVNPNKPTTIPRLELLGALLAARLSRSVLESLRCPISRSVYWTDSSLVLGWLQTAPGKLKTFVANRIVEICDLTSPTNWRHVPTDKNPADLISRGTQVQLLQKSELWWSGPKFLTKLESEWPILNNKIICDLDLPEVKCHIVQNFEPVINFLRFSKFMRLKRSFAYVLRFIHNTRFPKTRLSGALKANELTESFHFLCKFSQLQSFSTEYDALTKNRYISTKSNLLSLSPFIDKFGVMRVGGRLACSNYDYDKRHPIILHSKHHLTCLIFQYEHLKQMHAGPQLLLYTVRDYVWPIGGRNLARSTTRNCVRCRRLQGRTYSPVMGHLPSQRTTPSVPFQITGVDYAGPFTILNKKGRGARVSKCYLCLFVCFSFKCVHLEAVTELSKDAFILTLRRFIARRGKPSQIYSDNGRNFVAAAKEIGNFLKYNSDTLSDFAANEGIKFNFIPSYAPHFGGLWEAGIKSAKHHIKRVMANLNLTYEELSTLFAQVEAILNSRPLCPISPSPHDFQSLTPGHFLIGRPLTSLPDPGVEDCSSHLQRHARIEQARKHFWNRWQREYVNELQQRLKWRTSNYKLAVGDLVLLQEDNSPPLHWRMGRVLRLYPGVDGVARVADITTQRGIVRRALSRLCPLPVEGSEKAETPTGFSGGELMLAPGSANKIFGPPHQTTSSSSSSHD